MYRLSLTFTLVLVSACGGKPPTPPTEPDAQDARQNSGATEMSPDDAEGTDPAQLAREFWVRLSRGEYAAAAELASYPFDLDAHQGCVESSEDLLAAFNEDPLPTDKELVVGEVREIVEGMDTSGLHEHWLDRIPRWTGPDAPCLGDDTQAEYRHFLVDFTVNGNMVGSLTRVRCVAGVCGVAGTDN